MPEIIDSLPSKRGREAKYAWDEWMDGQTRRFRAGVDFDAKPSSFASQARAAADERGLKVSVRHPEDGIVAFEAFTPEDEASEDVQDEPEAPTAEWPSA